MNILVIGDVVSDKGCEFLRAKLPGLKKLKSIDYCIANGENSAVGNGVTPHSAEYLFDSGVDFITLGNHAFRRHEVYEYLDSCGRIIRPANFHSSCPGKGYAKVDLGYAEMLIINLMGRVYMDDCGNPFDCVDEILSKEKCRITLVDFHGEATAEKKAMGYYLDGRVSAVFGTHTHVMTADAEILPKGTGYITDLGMTGPVNSVLGVKPEISIGKIKTGMPARFDTADGECMINGCIYEKEKNTGLCTGTEPLNIR